MKRLKSFSITLLPRLQCNENVNSDSFEANSRTVIVASENNGLSSTSSAKLRIMAVVAVFAAGAIIAMKWLEYQREKENRQLSSSIQRGIKHEIKKNSNMQEQVVLTQDFRNTEVIPFTGYKFTVYSPAGFRHFRTLYDIDVDDYLISLCHEDLVEIINPGASGSNFYRSKDRKYFIKTVPQDEAVFLQQLLLQNYYNNLKQMSGTLLPKFFGLYEYDSTIINNIITFIVMRNVFPLDIEIHQKYDLKGSRFRREASKKERKRKDPTYKDLDFLDHHHEGLSIDSKRYNELTSQISSDCMVLEKCGIMDYSLLLGIHNVDNHRYPYIGTQVPEGSIPGRNAAGDRIFIFVGIIDILQTYTTKKELEHTVLSFITDGDTVSTLPPKLYRERFIEFMEIKVFKKIPARLGKSQLSVE